MLRKLAAIFTLSLLLGAASFAGVYSSTTATPLGVGELVQVWATETPTPGTGTTAASTAVVMAPGQNGTVFYAHGIFSGDPGAVEVDVQVSPDNVDTHYQTIGGGNITSVDATNFTFHLDGTLTDTRFARLLMRTRTNSVFITAWIGR